MAVSSRPPPYGICPYPLSRAIYAVDFMLKWSTGQNGECSFKINQKLFFFLHTYISAFNDKIKIVGVAELQLG